MIVAWLTQRNVGIRGTMRVHTVRLGLGCFTPYESATATLVRRPGNGWVPMMSRRTSFAVLLGLLLFLLLSVLLQVWVVPAAVERAVSTFPEVQPLAVPAVVWGVCAIMCWQAIVVLGMWRVRRTGELTEGVSARGWLYAVIGCLLAFFGLVFFGLVASAFVVLNERGYTPPGVMLGLIGGGLIALIAAGSLALLF